MIVITGAAGFIGSCILARLNEVGRKDIILVDHLNHDLKKENLKNKKFFEYFEKKDFINLIKHDRLNSKVDLMIHMGACSSTILQDRNYFLENNFEYSCLLASWCFKRQIRFIYASSAATYGDGTYGYRDDIATIQKCKPLNYYGESKQMFDAWILDNKFIDKCVGLKFFNVYGPNEYHKGDMRSVVAKAYSRVVEEGQMGLFKSYHEEYGDGEQKRDFIYVKDAVDIVMFFVGHFGKTGIYNVGTGKARTWNDLACALFAAVGKRPNIEYIEMPKILRERYQYFTQADMMKLRKTGYTEPFSELEEAVKDYVEYLKENAHI